jgi:putative methionine-R-sulfoxide reductase with GAF domain
VYLLLDGVLRCQAARGYFQVVDGFGLGTGVIGRIAATGRATLIRDVAEHPEFIAAVPGVVSEAGVPVWVADRIAAVVNVESTRPLPRATLAVLGAAAQQLGAWMTQHGGPRRRRSGAAVARLPGHQCVGRPR